MALEPKLKRALQLSALIAVVAIIGVETYVIVSKLVVPARNPAAQAIATGSAGNLPAPAEIDGMACDSMEGQVMHIHAQLQIYDNGKAVPIPAGIGIVNGCYYWLHTHTADGIIHVESPVVKTFTLGMFFDVWGHMPVAEGTGFHILVDHQDGKGFRPYDASYKNLVLTAHEIVALGTGSFTPQVFSFPAGL